jgi:hypothetical protein
MVTQQMNASAAEYGKRAKSKKQSRAAIMLTDSPINISTDQPINFISDF